MPQPIGVARVCVPAVLSVSFLACADPAGARIVVLPAPVKFQLVVPNQAPFPAVPHVKAFFHVHVTANGLLQVERLVLTVTRKADGTVWTKTLEAKEVAYGTTRLQAGSRQRWEIPVELFAPFATPSEAREFDLKIDARLAVKASDTPIDLSVEPGLVEDR